MRLIDESTGEIRIRRVGFQAKDEKKSDGLALDRIDTRQGRDAKHPQSPATRRSRGQTA
jgi:hypothetical protein